MRHQNEQITFIQIFHNMMNMGNIMNWATNFITSSDQILEKIIEHCNISHL